MVGELRVSCSKLSQLRVTLTKPVIEARGHNSVDEISRSVRRHEPFVLERTEILYTRCGDILIQTP